MKWLRLCVLGAALGVLAGCATSQPQSSFPVSGDPLTDGPTALARGPARDRVLWQYRIAAADFRTGQFAEAGQMLDEALARVGGNVGPDRLARRSRGMFHEEAKKTFIGEPYERVMAYYYRGILYWMAGELDNARACFRSGEVEDSDTENKEYAADYVLLDYLDGLASTKLAADGSEAFQRAVKESRSSPAPPPYDKDANALFFLEYGRGPGKYASGEYNEELRFLPGRSDARRVRITVDTNAPCIVGPYDDLTFQATTRGGRVMDHILANKAVFKSASDTVGNVAMVGGLAMAAASRDTREAGLGLAAFGLVSKIVSGATTPAADTRAWDNLPQYLSFAAFRLPPGEHTATVEFLTESGMPLSSCTKTVKFKVGAAAKDAAIFVSDQSSNSLTYENN